MKVFLSWSGEMSHQIAQRLYGWLPMVIQKVEPYISSDIEKGSRWSTDVAGHLENCKFGIACITPDNREAPWLLFEAGALSKSVAEGRLAPLLFGLDQSDIQRSPLTQFQMTKFEKVEFFKLLQSINESLETPLDGNVLSGSFEAHWPKLSMDVESLKEKVGSSIQSKAKQVDPDKIMGAMDELLANTRSISQVIANPDRLLPREYLAHVLDGPARGAFGSTGNVTQASKALTRALQMIGELQNILGVEFQAQCDAIKKSVEEARVRVRREIQRPISQTTSLAERIAAAETRIEIMKDDGPDYSGNSDLEDR